MFAALDLASGEMFCRFRDRKRWWEFLGFLKQLRRRFPTGRLYLVCGSKIRQPDYLPLSA